MYFLLVLVFVAVLSPSRGAPGPEIVDQNVKDRMHVFVLLVPDSAIENLHKSRQDETDAVAGLGEFPEAGVYIGQIINGVLGGDVRPILAGSVSFIDEPDVQQGVSTILANVAPGVNKFIMQWWNRAQTTLGLATTVRPGTLNSTLPPNGQVAGRPQQGQPLQQQTQQAQQQQQGQPGAPPSVVNPSGEEGEEPSTTERYVWTSPEPLPLINPKTPDEDDDDGRKGNLDA